MFLKLDSHFKIVFELSQKLKDDPSYMELIQSVTLDQSKPYIGLKGNNGLFGSDIWWDNIKKNVIRTNIIKGKIVRLYNAGQDSLESYNSFDLLLSDGSIWSESIYINNRLDNDLFKIGSLVCIFYAHDERKQSISGDISYSDTVIEMAVSI
ncbi:hypothetical protein RGC63_07800 [Helicobacter pylori]|jgi:hypothetical protein pcarcW_03204|uniref:Uncharacterized protein n=1 Tax=Helicobacter pylori TaxID=210 RepID=A0AAW9KQS8_HELPX|nr:hypothetical protein [Helicobacter pylori]MDZ7551574.1 hypothetical protein [Helicobacter pylori]